MGALVADEALARILRRPEDGGDLGDVEALTDPAAHAKEGDFQRDSTGRRAGAAPHSSRQNSPQHRLRGSASVAASAGEEDQHLEAQGFARRVAQHLADAWQQKRFDELRIVAAPRFLGRLRKEIDAHVSAAVSGELDKDLIHGGQRRHHPAPVRRRARQRRCLTLASIATTTVRAARARPRRGRRRNRHDGS